jgi:hypothetical protein
LRMRRRLGDLGVMPGGGNIHFTFHFTAHSLAARRAAVWD